MIKSVSVINHRGERLDIDLRFPWGTGLALASIDGIHPPQANINSTELSTMDGSVYNSARIAQRNITIQFILLHNLTIEQARHILYKYFPIKKQIRFEIITDERQVYALGYVESVKVGIFSKMEAAEVSLICTDPYFYSINDNATSINDIAGGFEFPFTNPVGTESLVFGEITPLGPVNIINNGDAPVGLDIFMHFTGSVGDIRIYSVTTDQEILLNTSNLNLQSGDEIHICTITGKKSVTLYRQGVAYNALSSVSKDTGWIQLEPGDNIIVITAEGLQNAQISITNKIIYEGV